ncbi:MAG: hypothetical protein Q4C70_03865 [Planctomycetia bacterium]|nr:hypothetical protein [Planctomycetia bacterium]
MVDLIKNQAIELADLTEKTVLVRHRCNDVDFSTIHIGNKLTLISADAFKCVSDFFLENSRLTTYSINDMEWVILSEALEVGDKIENGGFPLVSQVELERIKAIFKMYESLLRPFDGSATPVFWWFDA